MSIQVAKARTLLERFGGRQAGVFTPGGVPLDELASGYATPFYLYHAGMLADRVNLVRDGGRPEDVLEDQNPLSESSATGGRT